MSTIVQLLARSAARSRVLAILVAFSFASLMCACGGGGGGGGGDGGSAKPPLGITAQPADVTVVAGASATLTVAANEAATYQWQHLVGTDWTPLAGATGASLVIAATQPGDDGQYRVVVTAVSGGAVLTSATAAVHVTPAPLPPAITLSPGDLTLVEGQGGSLSVTATGTSITYQWQSSADAVTWVDVAGATSATLVLPPAALADDGRRFRVVVTNAQGAVTSAAARLAVTPAPVAPTFTTLPADVTAVAGQGATFVVAVSGVPVPTLAWQSSTDGTTWTDIAGATSTSLVIASVSVSDSGKRFRAQATNASGTVDTPAATLTVTPAPVAAFITTPPAAVSVGVGGTPAFHVVAGGTPAPTLQWQVSTDAGATFANVTGATGADLALAAVTLADGGKQFRVVAQNATGTVTSAPALLTVRPPPQITQQPQAQAWRSGLPTPQFKVAAAGTGLTYQWQLCNAAGASCANISGATSASVAVTPPAADASVRAVVTNATGDSATSNAASLARLHWKYVSGMPTGATLRDLAWLDATTVVAVGDAGVVLRSNDSGSTWQTTREAEAARQVSLNGVAFGSATVGVAVGRDGLLLRTSDGGQHWLVVGAGVTPQLLWRVAFNDAQTVVAVGMNGTVVRSTDAGLTWAVVNAGTTDVLSSVTFRGGVGLMSGSLGTVYRSINGGAQWTQVLAASSGTSYSGEVAFVSNSVAVLAYANASARSTDGGLTWQATVIGGTLGPAAVGFKDALSGVALPSTDRSPTITTTDGGATWTQSATWPGSGAFAQPGSRAGTAVRFSSSGVGIATALQGILYRTADGGQTWTELDTTGVPQYGNLAGVTFASPTVGVAWGDYQSKSLYRTIDGGAHWSVVGANVTPTGVLDCWLKVQFSDANTASAVDSNGHTARSTDGGITWVAGQDLGTGRILPGDIAFANASVGILLTSGYPAMFTTTNGGQTWTPQLQAPSPRALSVAWLTPTTLVAAATNGVLSRSTDAGVTWTTVYTAGYGETMVVRLSSSGLGVAMGVNGHVHHSTDGGLTWRDVSLPTMSDSIVDAWFVSATEVYAIGTHVWRSTDGGATWSLDLVSQKSDIDAWLNGGTTSDGTASIAVGSRGIVMRREP